MFCLFLVSCSKKSFQNPFDKANSLTGSYGDFTVNVTKDGDCVRVIPDSPDGYLITFSDKGAEVSFNGIKFEANPPELSRFYPLFEMVRGINTTFTENTVVHSDGYVFGDFK